MPRNAVSPCRPRSLPSSRCPAASRLPAVHRSNAPLAAAALALAAAAGLAGCAYSPPELVRYEIEGPEDVWDNGMRLHPVRTDSLTVLTGFADFSERSTHAGPLFGSPLTFLVLAHNTSKRTLTLDPLCFRLHVPASGSALTPLDPETEIRDAARNMIDTDGRYRQDRAVDAAVHLPLDLLNIFVGPFVETTPEQREEQNRYQEERRENRRNAARKYERDMQEATSRRDEWSQRALRKTTLLPGMRTSGLVSFEEDTTNGYPDTVVLQYRFGDSLPADLGRYTRIPDAGSGAPKVAATPPKPGADSLRRGSSSSRAFIHPFMP